jgi:cytochrome d ubiquinol oxidase subunit I
VIVPLQGGLIPATMITGTPYDEDLPIQAVDFGPAGRTIFIAFVMLTHVLFANLHLGGSWVAAGTESFFLKNGNERYDRLARSVTIFNVILFSAGATFAIGGVLFFISLFPVFATNAFHIFWWPLFAEAILFGLEILFLYTYWFSWYKIPRKYHQVLGYAYAVSVFFQTLMINMLAAGMLTPGDTTITWGSTGFLTMDLPTLLQWWFNPTMWRLQFHRIFASISYFGFLLALLAMFHFLDRKDNTSKRYWDWVGSYGLAWGLFGLVFQPAFGLIYMLAIFDNQEPAFDDIMHGPRAWEMLLMVSLLAALFIVVIIYFIDRRERILSKQENKIWHRLFQVFLIVAVICALILIQPAWLGASSIDDPAAWQNPIGVMDYKYIAIFTLVIIGVLLLTIDTVMLADPREAEWGALPKVSRFAAMMAGVLGMWIVIVMGFVRESARSPWTIYQIIPVPGGAAFVTPVPMVNIFAVWFIILMITITIFWFTSKVTAHHPEEAEEVDLTRAGEQERPEVTGTDETKAKDKGQKKPTPSKKGTTK